MSNRYTEEQITKHVESAERFDGDLSFIADPELRKVVAERYNQLHPEATAKADETPVDKTDESEQKPKQQNDQNNGQ